MTTAAPGAFSVAYSGEPVRTLLARPQTLAVFSFDGGATRFQDPRHLGVLQTPLATPAPRELWSVAGAVRCGDDAGLHWAAGGGWRFAAIDAIEADADAIEAATADAYERLLAHVAASAEPHFVKIWNYLGAINAGAGDAERYRRFCAARARVLAARGLSRFPAATAIGHDRARDRLQVYALSSARAGSALENPRQMSAWEYPRQYGPAAPLFARAMRLPDGGLAISGTAAVIGHASHHAGDVAAQAGEALANLRALLERAALPAFDARSPLKVYVRDPRAADAVRAVLDRHLDPAVPRLLLQGDVCRRELLVEIDGWRFGAERQA